MKRLCCGLDPLPRSQSLTTVLRLASLVHSSSCHELLFTTALHFTQESLPNSSPTHPKLQPPRNPPKPPHTTIHQACLAQAVAAPAAAAGPQPELPLVQQHPLLHPASQQPSSSGPCPRPPPQARRKLHRRRGADPVSLARWRARLRKSMSLFATVYLPTLAC